MKNNSITTLKLAQAALLAALCFIGFQFFRFDIPVGPERTAFHFGNVFCVLAALLLGGPLGGTAGAVGLTIADFTSGYAMSSPKTFLLKLCIGLIVGFVAHRIGHLNEKKESGEILKWTILSASAGMLFNIFADPIVGYYYKTYILSIPQDITSVLAKLSAVTTFVNAIAAVLFSTILYSALRPALSKAHLLLSPKKVNTN